MNLNYYTRGARDSKKEQKERTIFALARSFEVVDFPDLQSGVLHTKSIRWWESSTLIYKEFLHESHSCREVQISR